MIENKNNIDSRSQSDRSSTGINSFGKRIDSSGNISWLSFYRMVRHTAKDDIDIDKAVQFFVGMVIKQPKNPKDKWLDHIKRAGIDMFWLAERAKSPSETIKNRRQIWNMIRARRQVLDKMSTQNVCADIRKNKRVEFQIYCRWYIYLNNINQLICEGYINGYKGVLGTSERKGGWNK